MKRSAGSVRRSPTLDVLEAREMLSFVAAVPATDATLVGSASPSVHVSSTAQRPSDPRATETVKLTPTGFRSSSSHGLTKGTSTTMIYKSEYYPPTMNLATRSLESVGSLVSGDDPSILLKIDAHGTVETSAASGRLKAQADHPQNDEDSFASGHIVRLAQVAVLPSTDTVVALARISTGLGVGPPKPADPPDARVGERISSSRGDGDLVDLETSAPSGFGILSDFDPFHDTALGDTVDRLLEQIVEFGGEWSYETVPGERLVATAGVITAVSIVAVRERRRRERNRAGLENDRNDDEGWPPEAFLESHPLG